MVGMGRIIRVSGLRRLQRLPGGCRGVFWHRSRRAPREGNRDVIRLNTKSAATEAKFRYSRRNFWRTQWLGNTSHSTAGS